MYGLEFTDKISRNQAFARIVRQKKQALIDEAVAWSGKTIKNTFDFHNIWESADKRYKISLGKYGKEYYLNTIRWKNGNKANNPNDMRPTVYVDGIEKDFDGSFDHIFNFFQDISKISEDALRIIGCLMFRNALLVDHIDIENGKGCYRYCPPREALDFILEKVPLYDGISTEAYLHYLEAIAWNEDVKYSTLGFDVNDGTGRTNNMKTYAHIIAVLLGKASFAKLCSSFSRPPVGVSPITNATAKDAFPELEIKL